MVDFDRLNRETWAANNIGNQHHHSNTGIKHPTDFDSLNRETRKSRGIDVRKFAEFYKF